MLFLKGNYTRVHVQDLFLSVLQHTEKTKFAGQSQIPERSPVLSYKYHTTKCPHSPLVINIWKFSRTLGLPSESRCRVWGESSQDQGTSTTPKKGSYYPKERRMSCKQGKFGFSCGWNHKNLCEPFPSSSSHSAHTHPMQSKHDSNEQNTTEHYKGSLQGEISARHQTWRKLQAD